MESKREPTRFHLPIKSGVLVIKLGPGGKGTPMMNTYLRSKKITKYIILLGKTRICFSGSAHKLKVGGGVD